MNRCQVTALIALAALGCDYSGQYRVRVQNTDASLMATTLAHILDDPKIACGDGRSRDIAPKTADAFLAMGTVYCHDWRSTADIEARFDARSADVRFIVVAGPGGGLLHKSPDAELAADFRTALLEVTSPQNIEVTQPTFAETVTTLPQQ
jgi:hypothetical protein